MSAVENKELIRNMFAELGRGNADAFLGAMADDLRYTLMGNTRFSGTFNGKAELISKLLAPLTAALTDGIALTPYNLIADGDFVAMQAHGKAMSKTYCHIFKFANGKIVEVTEYLDTELVTSVFGK
jgi:ketosteroid isomerase-like protein